jgi:hypothetical protein
VTVVIKLFVPGIARPQGSKDFVGFAKAGRPIFRESNRDLILKQ